MGAMSSSEAWTDGFPFGPGPSVGTVGATGSTSYSYYAVAHTYGGGTSLLSAVTTITNGNATLSATNYNTIGTYPYNAYATRAQSYDLIKQVGSSYYLVGSVQGNGSVNDQGQSLSAYAIPTADTTGQTTFSGTVNAPTVNATTGFRVNGTALAASNLSNGTTGTGAVVLANAPTLTGTVGVQSLSASTAITTPAVYGSGSVSVAVGASAGSGATAVGCPNHNSTFLNGCVYLTTGSSPSSGVMATISFLLLSNYANCVVGNGSSSSNINPLLPSAIVNSLSSMEINFGSAPAADTTYTVYYMCGD